MPPLILTPFRSFLSFFLIFPPSPHKSSTQVPDHTFGTVTIDSVAKPIGEVIGDDGWLSGEFVSTVQKRGAAIIKARCVRRAVCSVQCAVCSVQCLRCAACAVCGAVGTAMVWVITLGFKMGYLSVVIPYSACSTVRERQSKTRLNHKLSHTHHPCRQKSSAMSAANAIGDHLRTWLVTGSRDGDFVSLAVPSDGSYGIEEGLVFSFPVTCPGDGTCEYPLPTENLLEDTNGLLRQPQKGG